MRPCVRCVLEPVGRGDAEQDPDGGSNIWYRAATLLVSHWLI